MVTLNMEKSYYPRLISCLYKREMGDLLVEKNGNEAIEARGYPDTRKKS